jgi:1-acyl-sn-glycerol-3-phosphate acyltransferase
MSQPRVLQYQSPILQKFPPLFGNRNFILLWAGYVISAVGDRIHFLVMLALLTKIKGLAGPGTPESSQLTIMMLLPFVLFGPVTGILADRLPRRGIMIVSDLVRVAVVIAARTIFLEYPDLPYRLAMLLFSEFILATFAATFSPARLALLPNLVHPDQLLRANSMTNAAGTVASLLGFVLGGFLVSWHLTYAMYIDAGTFLLSAMCIIFMRVPRYLPDPALAAKPKTGLVTEFTEGLRYIANHKRVFQIILLMLLFWSCGTIILNGLTGIVIHHFGLDEAWFGYFMGLVGIGMVIGAASVSLARRGIPKEVGIAWAMVAVGVFLFFFAQADNWKVGLVLLMIASAAGAVLLVSLDTLLQRTVPDFVRGRVMGVKDVITTFGLISVAIPLAIKPDIDNIIRTVLAILSVVVMCVGLWLVAYYYKRQPMPWPAAVCRRIGSAFMSVWHNFTRLGACTIPGQGPVIVVANHSNAMDPIILLVSSPRRVIHFMMAKEYYEKKPLNYLYRGFGVIPVNRSGNDISSVRTALRTLKDGRVLGMFPEGRISEDGKMQDAKSGVAMLALMSGAPVVPAFIFGVNVYKGMVADFVHKSKVRVVYGAPMRFEQFKGRERDEAAREEVTQLIMAAIKKMCDRYAPEKAQAKNDEARMTNDESMTKAQ